MERTLAHEPSELLELPADLRRNHMRNITLGASAIERTKEKKTKIRRRLPKNPKKKRRIGKRIRHK
jgi:hypothetical protein